MRAAIRASGLSVQHIPPGSEGAATTAPAFVIVPDSLALRAAYAADAADDEDANGIVVTLEQLKAVLATGTVGRRR